MEDVFVVKAKQDNARILKQQGLFMIFGIEANKLNPATIPFEWILNRTDKSLKMVIKRTYRGWVCPFQVAATVLKSLPSPSQILPFRTNFLHLIARPTPTR